MIVIGQTLTPEEAVALRRLLVKPVFQKAMAIVQAEMWMSNRNKETQEAAALAWAFTDGVASTLSALQVLAANPRTAHPPTARAFRPEPPIY